MSEASLDDQNLIQEDHQNRHEKALKETKRKNYFHNFRKSCKVAKKEAGENVSDSSVYDSEVEEEESKSGEMTSSQEQGSSS